jgi:hypothetical protein
MIETCAAGLRRSGSQGVSGTRRGRAGRGQPARFRREIVLMAVACDTPSRRAMSVGRASPGAAAGEHCRSLSALSDEQETISGRLTLTHEGPWCQGCSVSRPDISWSSASCLMQGASALDNQQRHPKRKGPHVVDNGTHHGFRDEDGRKAGAFGPASRPAILKVAARLIFRIPKSLEK